MRNHHTIGVLVAGLLLGTLTACSSSGEPKTIRTTVTQTVTATPGEEAAAKTDDGTLKMGARKGADFAEDNIHITIQALEYQQPYKGPQPQIEDFQGGDTWATASVKVCNVRGADITVDQSVWSLAYADGTNIEITGSSGGDMPKPEYPMDKTVKAGRCAAGLIAFPVPGKTRPARLVYQPEDSDPVEWAIPKR
ncbi:DUF4352 domain-containing protein [Streptomyces sp. NPDC056975]|uniref:DUF4352 domain-containing protein n=1 Tax=Streptomyces sp. NPDC056975 TaxID=3345985 RepID=UPI00362993F1